MALIRRTLALVAIGVGGVLVAAGSTGAVPEHLHCITTPNGETHAIAGGVTNHAPHDPAFHNFHGHVHMGAFATNPIPIEADLTEPYTCPPSP